MKTNKRISIMMIFVCIIAIAFSCVIEYIPIADTIKKKWHTDFWENMFLGIFASGLLVLISGIIQYNVEKRNYYRQMLRYANKILHDALMIIDSMEKVNNKADIDIIFSSFNTIYNEIVELYSSFTYVFFFTGKDKLIESILNEITKFGLIQDEVLMRLEQLAYDEISQNVYSEYMKKIKEISPEKFKEEFQSYILHIDNIIKKTMEDRTLTTYTEF